MANLWVETLKATIKKPERPQPLEEPEGFYSTAQKEQFADDLLNNPLWKWVLRRIRQEAIEVWESSPHITDTETRDKCWLTVGILKEIHSKIGEYIANAQFERVMKEKKESK